MNDTPDTIAKIKADLDQRREGLLDDLTTLIKAQIIKAARQNGTPHFIIQFNENRRTLGYLNRLPQELGRYADALEGLVRASWFPVGNSVRKAMQEIEDAYYDKIAMAELRGPKQAYTPGRFLEIEGCLCERYKDILFLTTIPQIVKKWRRVSRKVIFWKDRHSPIAPLRRLFTQLFSPNYAKMETAAHARGLATLIKSDAFKEKIKTPLKLRCRADITEIEIRICGEERKPLGLCVVPDVEDRDPHISDWISSTAVRTHAKELATRFPEIAEPYKSIERRLIEVQEKMDELKNPDLNCPEEVFHPTTKRGADF